jgi:prolycopene isomerase
MNNEASKNAYDVIIVGGGIGGLTCGAFLAQAGKGVLVVEQEERAGGFAREFQHGPYKINPALHLIMGCGPSGPYGHGLIDEALRQLGVRDQCEFTSVNPFYRVQFPDFQMDVPTSKGVYIEALQQFFPEESEGIDDLVNLCTQVYQESMRFPMVPRLRDWALMPFRFPKLFRHANTTLGSVMNRYLLSPQLKSAYAVLWPYVGLPPSRVSFSTWATMMSSYIEEGAFYCNGGFQGLVDAIADSLVNHGGELLLGERVTKIRAANACVEGISLENGQEINAPLVVSNIDARTTFHNLLEPGQVSARYLHRLGGMELCLSTLGLHLATDLDVHALSLPKVTLITPWNIEGVYKASLVDRVNTFAMHIPTVYDATLAPPGEHLVILQVFIPSGIDDLTPSASDQIAEILLAGAERVLPDLRDHITFVQGATDEQRYPLHRLGPIYGWAATPQQSGPRRLPNKTPVNGLYLVGHWTQPGHGIWTVVLSGINTSRLVLGDDPSERLWPFDL